MRPVLPVLGAFELCRAKWLIILFAGCHQWVRFGGTPDVYEQLLLDILHLFADTFETVFGVDDGAGDCDLIGLTADGVEFAVDLLAEEVQLAADGFRAG